LLLSGESVVTFLQNQTAQPYFDSAKQLLFVIIPLAFHFYNINKKYAMMVGEREWRGTGRGREGRGDPLPLPFYTDYFIKEHVD
jgi:hypothetical protein